MLLVMVDDFCCVVIKFVECIIYFRIKNCYSEEDIVFVVKECLYVYVFFVNCLGIG